MIKASEVHAVGPRRVARRIARTLARPGRSDQVEISNDYRVLDAGDARALVDGGNLDGWYDRTVAERQAEAWRPLVEAMRTGAPRSDLLAAAEAVARTAIVAPSVVEVGCGGGWYSEILEYLLGRRISYVGVDSSWEMVRLAHRAYPTVPFIADDAIALPFGDASFDVVLNGAALMHMLHYEAAIRESRRVARGWCILHTVPVLQTRATTLLSKRAYGGPVIEVVFNEAALRDLLERNGFVVRHILHSLEYDLAAVLGESTTAKTYVCQAV
jgi:SAM-dependent methyltransferase